MKRLTITFAIITLFFSCITLPKNYTPVGYKTTSNINNLPCEDLYQNIAEKWGYHQIFKPCYYYNEKLTLSITQNQDCFIGLSEKEIIQIFGNPTTIAENKITYSLSRNCSEIDTLFASRSLKFKILDSKVQEVKLQEADVHY